MEELAAAIGSGARAVVLFVIQIASADRLAVARDIDPAFAAAFDVARGQGVQMLAWRCNVNLNGIEIAAPVPVIDE
jgi:sugar fermentation stimulation protein A